MKMRYSIHSINNAAIISWQLREIAGNASICRWQKIERGEVAI